MLNGKVCGAISKEGSWKYEGAPGFHFRVAVPR